MHLAVSLHCFITDKTKQMGFLVDFISWKPRFFLVTVVHLFPVKDILKYINKPTFIVISHRWQPWGWILRISSTCKYQLNDFRDTHCWIMFVAKPFLSLCLIRCLRILIKINTNVLLSIYLLWSNYYFVSFECETTADCAKQQNCQEWREFLA
jgi:hypothetical protein